MRIRVKHRLHTHLPAPFDLNVKSTGTCGQLGMETVVSGRSSKGGENVTSVDIIS